MTLPVPLDRSGRVPGAVQLAVRRSPAVRGPALGTVLFVAGGPGESAIAGFFPGLGMGLPLISQFTDSLELRSREEGGAEVSMRFHLTPEPAVA